MMLTPPPSPGCPAFVAKQRSRYLSPPEPPHLALPSPPRSPSPPQSPPSPQTIASLAAKTQPSHHHSRQRHETHIFHQHHSFHEKALDYLSTVLSRNEKEKVAVTAWMGSPELHITVAYTSDEDFEDHARDVFRSLLRLACDDDTFDSLCTSLIRRSSARFLRPVEFLNRTDNSGRSVYLHLYSFAYDTQPYMGDVRERRRILIPSNIAPYFQRHGVVRGFERSNMRKWLRVLVTPLEVIMSDTAKEESKAAAALEIFNLLEDECMRRVWRGLLRAVYLRMPLEMRDVDFEEIFVAITVVPKALAFLKQGWEKDQELKASLKKTRVVLLKSCNACPEAQLMSLYDLGVRKNMHCYSTPQYIGKSDHSCKGCRILKTILGWEQCERLMLDDSGSESDSAVECVEPLMDRKYKSKRQSSSRQWRPPALLRKELVSAVDKGLKDRERSTSRGR